MFTRFNKPAEEYVYLGDKRVEIPKLTVAKWKALFTAVETLPQLILSVLSAKGSPSFGATAVVAASMALDEAINIVAAITGIEAQYIEDNASLTELVDFIAKTARKNDLHEAAKKFRAVLGRFAKTAGTNGADSEI